jgi:putative ABC transport system ATP-binding protein
MNNGLSSLGPGPVLRAENLCKTYRLGQRSLAVLCGVNLTVEAGDFLVLRGASGAGKSTLLHLLGGLDTPNAGAVWLDGKNLAAFSEKELAAMRNQSVGFIFQAYHLLPELDALENVCLPARIARQPGAATESRARELLARVGLADRVRHRPYELSGGEQQRVVIARALVNEPRVLLADEPTGNLDSHTGAEILGLLCTLRQERGVTLVMATHDAKVAGRAERVLELFDGRVVDGSAAREGQR